MLFFTLVVETGLKCRFRKSFFLHKLQKSPWMCVRESRRAVEQAAKIVHIIYVQVYITELSHNAGTVLDNQVRAI